MALPFFVVVRNAAIQRFEYTLNYGGDFTLATLAIDGGRPVREPAEDARVYVLGLLNVLEAAAQHGVRSFVFASSGGMKLTTSLVTGPVNW